MHKLGPVQLCSLTQFWMQWLFDHIFKAENVNWKQISDIGSITAEFFPFAYELDF